MKYFILIFSLLFLPKVAMAECEQGCNLKLECYHWKGKDILPLDECFKEGGSINLKTGEGERNIPIEEVKKNNGIIEVPQYFIFTANVGHTMQRVIFTAIDKATNSISYTNAYNDMAKIYLSNLRR